MVPVRETHAELALEHIRENILPGFQASSQGLSKDTVREALAFTLMADTSMVSIN